MAQFGIINNRIFEYCFQYSFPSLIIIECLRKLFIVLKSYHLYVITETQILTETHTKKGLTLSD